MSKEKLTVESTVYKIQSKVFINTAEIYNPQKQGKKELNNFLEQIRDETLLNVSMTEYALGAINEVFDKYINEK